jgi:hypothetical protein
LTTSFQNTSWGDQEVNGLTLEAYREKALSNLTSANANLTSLKEFEKEIELEYYRIRGNFQNYKWHRFILNQTENYRSGRTEFNRTTAVNFDRYLAYQTEDIHMIVEAVGSGNFTLPDRSLSLIDEIRDQATYLLEVGMINFTINDYYAYVK